MENAWLINEPEKKRSKRSKKRKEVKRDMAKKKRAKKNEPKRKAKRHYKRNEPKRKTKRHYKRNEPARKSKRYRRNDPDPAIMEIVYAGVGYIGTKFAGNMIAPAIGMTSPIARMAIKSAVAYGGGKFVIGKFVSRKAGEMFMVGGLVEVISDAVKTYLAPSVPALAAYQEPLEVSRMGAYPELEAYPTTSETVGYDGSELEEVYG